MNLWKLLQNAGVIGKWFGYVMALEAAEQSLAHLQQGQTVQVPTITTDIPSSVHVPPELKGKRIRIDTSLSIVD